MPTEQERQDAILSAMKAKDYRDDEITSSGAPKVPAINDRMKPGHDPVTGKERDALYALMLRPDEQADPGETELEADKPEPSNPADADAETSNSQPEPAPEPDEPEADPDEVLADALEADPERVNVTVTRAAMNPVLLYVFGVGQFSIPWGKPTAIPREALPALSDSDVQFTTSELEKE